MNYLADTNVLSEPRQKSPNPAVVAWLEANEPNLYTSVLVIGEIRFGIELLPLAGVKRRELTNWFERLGGIMAGRILSVNARVAEEWAKLQAEARAQNLVLPVVDSLLAATARRYRLVVATNNVADFKAVGVKVINPFESSEFPDS